MEAQKKGHNSPNVEPGLCKSKACATCTISHYSTVPYQLTVLTAIIKMILTCLIQALPLLFLDLLLHAFHLVALSSRWSLTSTLINHCSCQTNQTSSFCRRLSLCRPRCFMALNKGQELLCWVAPQTTAKATKLRMFWVLFPYNTGHIISL